MEKNPNTNKTNLLGSTINWLVVSVLTALFPLGFQLITCWGTSTPISRQDTLCSMTLALLSLAAGLASKCFELMKKDNSPFLKFSCAISLFSIVYSWIIYEAIIVMSTTVSDIITSAILIFSIILVIFCCCVGCYYSKKSDKLLKKLCENMHDNCINIRKKICKNKFKGYFTGNDKKDSSYLICLPTNYIDVDYAIKQRERK